MVNLAIIVSVSEYLEQSKLSACKTDGKAMAEIVRSTNRFDDILVLENAKETEGARAQDAFASFAEKYRGKNVGEVLFYFTGHGSFDGSNLSLLLSDYSDNKKKQTSFQNSEIDATIRGLEPDLFVKIIDACESGVSYIKSQESFSDFVKSSSAGLKNIYFMFSSSVNQSSYASKDISFFTESFIRAVADHKTDKLRYKDIINAISDDYESNARQTPYFVSQAAMTETFAELNPSLRKLAESYVPGRTSAGNLAPSKRSRPIRLVEKIQAAEKQIATEEQAKDSLNKIVAHLSTANLGDDLGELYAWSTNPSDSLPDDTLKIGQWLENNDDDKFYFATPTTKTHTFSERVPKKSSLFNSNIWNISRILSNYVDDMEDDRFYRTVKKSMQVVDGFKHTANLPFQSIRVWLDPKSSSLTPEQCIVIPLVSRTRFQICWRFSHFRYIDWDKTAPTAISDWAMAAVPILDEARVQKVCDDIKSGFRSFVETALRAQWGGSDLDTPQLENQTGDTKDGS